MKMIRLFRQFIKEMWPGLIAMIVLVNFLEWASRWH